MTCDATPAGLGLAIEPDSGQPDTVIQYASGQGRWNVEGLPRPARSTREANPLRGHLVRAAAPRYAAAAITAGEPHPLAIARRRIGLSATRARIAATTLS